LAQMPDLSREEAVGMVSWLDKLVYKVCSYGMMHANKGLRETQHSNNTATKADFKKKEDELTDLFAREMKSAPMSVRAERASPSTE
jgi:hypothetical protein